MKLNEEPRLPLDGKLLPLRLTDLLRQILRAINDLYDRPTGGGGGGVSDHGALTGLADDDHTQYLNNARGDARYQPLALKGQVILVVPAGGEGASQTFAVPGVVGANVVTVSIAQHPDSDENSEEMLSVDALSASAGTDSITVTLALSEPTGGNVRINYQVT